MATLLDHPDRLKQLVRLEYERGQASADLGLRSFRAFCQLSWPHLLPGVPLVWNWHHDALCEHLQAILTGDIHRIVINIAPGFTKSTIVSVMFPTWCWLHHPQQRWLCAANNLSLALRDNMDSRRLIESEWYQQHYGHLYQLSGDQNAKMFYSNDHTGYRIAAGVSGWDNGKKGTKYFLKDHHHGK